MGEAGEDLSAFIFIGISLFSGAATITLAVGFPLRPHFCGMDDVLPFEGVSNFGPIYTQIKLGVSVALE